METDAPSQAQSSRTSRGALGWFAVLAVGWVLYELTTRPAVGVIAVCTKFGWEDFLAAVWLARRDPWRGRGRACFWLYLASGLCKAAGTAFLMLLGFAIIQPAPPGGGRAAAQVREAVLEAVAGAGLTNAFGLIAAAIALTFALYLARRHGVRLWLGRTAHRARRRNLWPPGLTDGHPSNGLLGVLMTVLMIVGVPLSALLFVGIGALVQVLFGGFPVFLIPVLSIGWVVGVAIFILGSKDWAIRRVVAGHPLECWDADGPNDVPTAPDGMA